MTCHRHVPREKRKSSLADIFPREDSTEDIFGLCFKLEVITLEYALK